MISLLRKIRKRDVDLGKAKSYLLYAIGEIILVVIGILIAVQINDLNEENKDRIQEQLSYCRLLEDVNQDELQLNNLIQDNSERLKSNKEMIRLLQDSNVERARLVKVMRESIAKIRFKFRPSLAAFEDLKSSGKLNILTDLSLKKKLLNYYAQMEGYSDISDIVADASLSVHNNPNKDFNEIGFQDIYYVKAELDSSNINLAGLNSNGFPSEKMRRQLLSDGIFHLNTNARKKELFKTMQNEIEKIKTALSVKCQRHSK